MMVKPSDINIAIRDDDEHTVVVPKASNINIDVPRLFKKDIVQL